MERPSPAVVLLLAALSVPLLIEARTVAGMFGVDLPLAAVVVGAVVVLVVLGLWLGLGHDPDSSGT